MPDNEELTTRIADELQRKRAEAQSAHRDFSKARDEAVAEATNAGTDVTSYLMKNETFEKMDGISKKASTLDEEVARLTDLLGMNARNASKGPNTDDGSPERKQGASSSPKTFGEQVASSSEFKSISNPNIRSGSWTSGPIELKATVTEGAQGTGSVTVFPPTWVPGVTGVQFQRPYVSDLLAQGATDSNSIRYVKETTLTNAATATSETALKPESTIIFGPADTPVKKIATFLPVSDEMLEDYAGISSYLNARLRLFIQLAEESQVLNGDPTVANHVQDLTGLLASATSSQAKGGDSNVDAIHKGITKVRLTFLEPDGLTINTSDYETLRLAKDSALQYYGGGPFTGAYGNGPIPSDSQYGQGFPAAGVWGLRTVITTSIAAGTALVGAYQTGAQLFRRGGITVEVSNSHSDFFQRNLTAIRAEERLALVVYRPASFCKVTGIS